MLTPPNDWIKHTNTSINDLAVHYMEKEQKMAQAREAMKDPVNLFLKAWNQSKIAPDGYSINIKQLEWLIQFLRKTTTIKTVLEIGFGTGLTTGVILSSRNDINIVSIDTGDHSYVMKGQKLIEHMFPEKFFLIVGDSNLVLPQLPLQPDLIYMDGAIINPTFENDMKNALAHCKPGTWILINHYSPNGEHHPDIKTAVEKYIKSGELTVLAHMSMKDSAWALCKRIF